MNRQFADGMEPIDRKTMLLIFPVVLITAFTVIFSSGFCMSKEIGKATTTVIVGGLVDAAILVPWIAILLRNWNDERKKLARKRKIEKVELALAAPAVVDAIHEFMKRSGTEEASNGADSPAPDDGTTLIEAPTADVKLVVDGTSEKAPSPHKDLT